MDKTCTKCKIPKELSEFSYDKVRDRYLSLCRKCVALNTEKYRQNNQDKWRQQSKNHSVRRKNAVDEWKSQGCIKCNDKRIYVIDAHHLDPSIKDFSIGTSINGINVTLNELKKCVPICSNCHREFHFFERLQNITFKEYLENFNSQNS